jgi:large subunit ribosomal protein L21
MSTYAIISVGGKQYRVREGERLLVDRLAHGEGNTFQPAVLLVGGGGETQISPENVKVTARVVADVKGEKIRIGKYRPKNGYKKHIGFRASLSQIEIESIGAGARRPPAKEAAKPRAVAAAPVAPAEAAPAEERVKGMPSGYEELTVAEIKARSAEWNRPMLQAALEYEQAHGNRKGALAALEAALAPKEEA